MKQKHIIIPKGPCLVMLVGPCGSGKSTFAKEHFHAREIISSDAIREELTGEFLRQDKNDDIFDEIHRRVEFRIKSGFRAVVDATHIKDLPRRRMAELGYMLDAPVFYIVIDRPLIGKLQTGGWRNDVKSTRKDGSTVTLIEQQHTTFEANVGKILSGDNNKWVTVLDNRNGDAEFTVVKEFDRASDLLRQIYRRDFNRIRVIGDVHGNLDGLRSVVDKRDDTFHLFLGDITDYGLKSWECASYVNRMVSRGKALMVRGNHDAKMYKYLKQTMKGEEFSGMITHGMDVSTNQLKAMIPNQARRLQCQFLSLYEQTPDWIELGDWIFVHAAVDYRMFGDPIFRANKDSRKEAYALYGKTDGTYDENGKPTRLLDWIDKMPKGKNAVLGHQILSTEAPVEMRTPTGGLIVFLDTGSSKDGFLSYMDFEIEKPKGKYTLVREQEYGRE